jgi:PPE-repeat protein
MRKTAGWMALLAVFALSAEAAAQTVTECAPGTGAAARQPGAGPQGILREYDVVVDVPDLCVETIRLNVQNLNARLALNAQVLNLVRVTAGADVHLGEVDLTIQGVRAQALLLVDLDNVVYAVDRVLTFVDENPQIVSQLVGTVNSTLGTVGGVANQALRPGGVADQAVGAVGQTLNNVTAPGGVLSQTVNTLGQTVQRTVDATGTIVERTLDTTGRVVSSRNVGRLLDLPVLNERTNSAGQTVRSVRDQSGAVIEYILDEAGRIVRSRVVTPARGREP